MLRQDLRFFHLAFEKLLKNCYFSQEWLKCGREKKRITKRCGALREVNTGTETHWLKKTLTASLLNSKL